MILDDQKLDMTDVEMVEKTLEHKKYFSLIVDAYSEKLSRYVRRITYVSEQDREDILQNVFIKIYINLNNYDDSLSFNAWAYRITHNEVIDFARKENRKKDKGYIDIEDDVFTLIRNSSDFMEDLYQREDAEKIKRVLEKMSSKYREIIYLRFIEQYSYRDISDILQKSESNVTSMIHRAKKEFKTYYEKEL